MFLRRWEGVRSSEGTGEGWLQWAQVEGTPDSPSLHCHLQGTLHIHAFIVYCLFPSMECELHRVSDIGI